MSTGQLYTIPFSHYCELGRWSLQEAKVPFVEYPYLPGTSPRIHSFFGPMERLRASAAKRGASTGKGPGTPLFVASDGKILDDSWQILELLGPGLPAEMKTVLNEEIGPHIRSIVYAEMTQPEKAQDNQPPLPIMNLHPYSQDGAFADLGKASPVAWWQRFLWSLSGFRGKVSSVLKSKMVGDAERQAKTLQDFEAAIEKARPRPKEIKLETFSEEMQQRIQKWRERPIGNWANLGSSFEIYRLDNTHTKMGLFDREYIDFPCSSLDWIQVCARDLFALPRQVYFANVQPASHALRPLTPFIFVILPAGQNCEHWVQSILRSSKKNIVLQIQCMVVSQATGVSAVIIRVISHFPS
eukprot:Skav207233  [mRNA]  locus=scaffold523:40334:45160:+ [translate_table: standard]